VSDTLLTAGIQQLNLGYDALQDRMLLRLGLNDKSEMTIWLTRRIVKAIWGMMQSANIAPLTLPDELTPSNQGSINDYAKAAVASPAMRNLDFTESYEERKSITQDPILPSDCSIVMVGKQSVLELRSREGHLARIPMNAELIQALTNMLQLTCKDAGWDLNFSASPILISEPTTQQVLH